MDAAMSRIGAGFPWTRVGTQRHRGRTRGLLPRAHRFTGAGGKIDVDDVREEIRRVMVNRRKVDNLEPRARRITSAVVAARRSSRQRRERHDCREGRPFTRVSLSGIGA